MNIKFAPLQLKNEELTNALGSNNMEPPLAVMTGSKIIGIFLNLISSKTAEIISAECSMPILMLSVLISSSTALICSRTYWGGIPKIEATPNVFCAVMAAITEVAKTPKAEIVLMSA